MGYDFYCTNCASKQNADTVLYDMQELIAGSAKLQILKFRLTEKELRELQQQGKALPNGEYQCTLTIPMLMKYIGNENNLNLPSLTELTSEQIRDFVEYFNQGFVETARAEEEEEEDNLYEEIDDGPAAEEKPEQAAPQPQIPQEKVWPKAIEDLKRQDKTSDAQEFAEGRVRDDLRLVRQLMLPDDSYTFTIRLETEKDDQGKEVVTGMTIGDARETRTRDNRICAKCGAKIFHYAGTAEHKSVVFIGDQSAGKTSTILAMTHYAKSHLQMDLGSEIWRGASSVKNVSDIKLLEPSPRLSKEFTLYNKGIAPRKTSVKERDNAYSATFLIKCQVGEKTVQKILTLMDLPGELCEWGGELRVDDIKNKFPVALACDTFVACFDTSTVEGAQAQMGGRLKLNPRTGEEELRLPSDEVRDTCSWADQFQKMLIRNTSRENYVPTMLLFTKCKDLEDLKKAGKPLGVTLKASNPVDAAYMFQEERQSIGTKPLFGFAQDQFGRTGDLSSAYYSVLRASPYGYAAPAENEIAENPDLEQNVHAPTPINIDKLMRWVMMVSGCVPAEGRYAATIGSTDYYELADYLIDRPQFRKQNPRYPGNTPDEALARCSLFANPGCHDRSFLSSYGNKARTIFVKVSARPDTNDHEG